MNFLTKILSKPKRDGDEERHVDSLLLRLHRNADDAQAAMELPIMQRRLGLSDKQLEQRLEAAIQRKAQAVEAQAKENLDPATCGDGVILKESLTPHRFLRLGGEGVKRGDAIEDYLRADGLPLPTLELTEFHQHPADEQADFEYAGELLKALDQKQLLPGRVSYIGERGDKLPPARRGFPWIDPENPPMAFRLDEWSFMRRRGQSERQLNAALKTLEKTLRARNRSDAMAPMMA